MNIPNELVREIISKVNIVELIGDHIPLNKNGKNYQALCPFHNEKTPSFTVYAECGRFRCFGCGEKGDAITFLIKKEGLSYPAAVKKRPNLPAAPPAAAPVLLPLLPLLPSLS